MRNKGIGTALVPSLYVRVYHGDAIRICARLSSLIICEGVSRNIYKTTSTARFPHYM